MFKFSIKRNSSALQSDTRSTVFANRHDNAKLLPAFFCLESLRIGLDVPTELSSKIKTPSVFVIYYMISGITSCVSSFQPCTSIFCEQVLSRSIENVVLPHQHRNDTPRISKGQRSKHLPHLVTHTMNFTNLSASIGAKASGYEMVFNIRPILQRNG